MRASGAPTPDGDRRAWVRLVGSDLDIRQRGAVAPQANGHMSGFQTGVDLWAGGDWRAGLYVGQLDGQVDVSGLARGAAGPIGSCDLHSQFLGGYATYAGAGGFYANAVLQAGRHRYTASPDFNLPVSGKGRGLLASLEVGQAFVAGERWTIEPQLQLAHQHLSLDELGSGFRGRARALVTARRVVSGDPTPN